MESGRSRGGWRRRGLVALAIAAVLALGLLGVLLVMEWRPEPIEDTPVHGATPGPPPAASSLALLSWNIGYAGLGADADFFMDGGEQVHPASLGVVQRNLEAVRVHLAGQTADVVLLQEVDSDAARSYGTDQVATLARSMPSYFYARALNFKVAWIPYPLREPIGRVESGLLTLTRHRPALARRHQLPGSYPWPVRVFHLKRCVHEVRLPAPGGRDWVVLHLHLSAFDRGGALRRQQMAYLRALMLRLVSEGHHVVAGGDWNQAPPGIDEQSFDHQSRTPTWFQRVPGSWTPDGFRWAFDREVPSLRATNRPYRPGESFVTVVDGFLVGPGIEVLEVHTDDLGFAHTDHHPVHLRLRLTGGEQPEEPTGRPPDPSPGR